ncbi:hypothetical protein N5079_19605 [Planotetraspora sp. A-T 1434]|uniref:hypothetical protein n=1 Tax=Planotetraspora sp. A-T 1434 TaxID=2979219 RepID=UPI0021C1B1E8|nr:hypothetical protein [Planotetraspora sp. A-T 1434]MCT9932410.1 hypothetical protein [Planotetraspora sp. A-T 1434]
MKGLLAFLAVWAVVGCSLVAVHMLKSEWHRWQRARYDRAVLGPAIRDAVTADPTLADGLATEWRWP